jgi:hypothetical protein
MPRSRKRKSSKLPPAQTGSRHPSRLGIYAFAIAICGNLLNVAGLVDGLVKWRDFFRNGLVEPYNALKSALFSLLPFELPQDIRDVVATSMFMFALQGSLWVMTPPAQRREFYDALGKQATWYVVIVFGAIPVATSKFLQTVTYEPFLTDLRERGLFTWPPNLLWAGALQLIVVVAVMVLWQGTPKQRAVVTRLNWAVLRAYAIFLAGFLAMLFLTADLPRLFSVA